MPLSDDEERLARLRAERGTELDAKLHQGHEANPEYRDQNQLLGAVQYAKNIDDGAATNNSGFVNDVNAVNDAAAPNNINRIFRPRTLEGTTPTSTSSAALNGQGRAKSDTADLQAANFAQDDTTVARSMTNNGLATDQPIAPPGDDINFNRGNDFQATVPASPTLSSSSGITNSSTATSSDNLNTPVIGNSGGTSSTSSTASANNNGSGTGGTGNSNTGGNNSPPNIGNTGAGNTGNPGTGNGGTTTPPDNSNPGTGSGGNTPPDNGTGTPPIGGGNTGTGTGGNTGNPGTGTGGNTGTGNPNPGTGGNDPGTGTGGNPGTNNPPAAPLVAVNVGTGVEGQPLAVSITVTPQATNNTTTTVTITGVPIGATLSAGTHNSDGSYTLTLSELANLTLNPPTNFSGDIHLNVSATTTDANGLYSSTTSGLDAVFDGTATTPTLTVTAANGSEDNAIALTINAGLVDNDGSETLSITVSSLPAGTVLSAGTQNPDGSWTLTPAQLNSLTLTPPANFAGDMHAIVTATSFENGTTASISSPLDISVSGVADAPIITTQPVSGAMEDNAIALQIGAQAVGDETVSITISGLPAGATLSAGIQNSDGSYMLTPAQLAGLTLNPPAHFSGDLNLIITATGSENGTSASSTTNLPIHIDGGATAPTLTVQAATGAEDSAIALHIQAGLVDNDGSENLSLTITGVPNGATLSAGVHNQDGSWTLTPAQLAGLMLTPPQDFAGQIDLHVTATSSENGTTASVSADLTVAVSGIADVPILSLQPASGAEDTAIALNIAATPVGAETVSVTIAGLPAGATLSAGNNNGDGSWTLTPAQLNGLTLTPPQDFSGQLALTVTANGTENNTSASSSANLLVNVTAVADVPVVNVQAASGSENGSIPLTITVTSPDSTSITIDGLPTGATLSAGTHNTDGSYTLTNAQLNGLTLTPPTNYSGDLNLTITATASDGNSTATTTAALPVHVDTIAITPSLTVSAASGSEDSAIALNINAALVDNNPSETLSINVAGLPAGASLSAGTLNSDGSYTLTAAQLNSLTLNPPANFNGDLSLTVTATSAENGTTATIAANLPVHVTGVADAPILSVQPASGNEDGSIPLQISTGLAAGDNGTLSITINNLPTGAVLSAGTQNNDGSWNLTPAQLSGLTLTPPNNYSGNFNLTVTATAAENGTSANTVASLPVTLSGVADTPNLAVQAATGLEDNAIPLQITTGLAAGDHGDLTVTITGVPNGASLSAGTHNQDGSWTLTPAQLQGLTLTPGANYHGDFNLNVTATASENNTSASTNVTLPISITAVADTPTLSVQAATGAEDTSIPLNIAAALTDTNETLSITVSGFPVGTTLSAGTLNSNGSYTLTAAQLSGLTLNPPANYSGDANLTIIATSTDGSSTATTSAVLPLHVTGVADTPSLSVQAAVGTEDSAIPLQINAALTDTDGSENLTIIIGNLPVGSVLSAGTYNSRWYLDTNRWPAGEFNLNTTCQFQWRD